MKKPDPLRIVLSIRLRAEEVEERLLAAACAAVFQAQDALYTMRKECTCAETECMGEVGGLLHGTDLQTREQRLLWLRKACDLSRETLAQRIDVRHTRQATYLEARRDREVMDTLLKQRALAEQVAQTRRETSRTDDLFLGRLSRRAGEADAT